MTYFAYSTDPFLDAFLQMMIVILLIIAIIAVVMFVGRSLVSSSKKTSKTSKDNKKDKEEKNGKKTSNKATQNWSWLFFTILVFVLVSVFLKMSLDRMKASQDQTIQKRYSWLYDYTKKEFTSPVYKGIYYVATGGAFIYDIFLVLTAKGGVSFSDTV